MKLRHIIGTRLGMGQKRRSYYARHIPILAATTLPSMVAQTSSDFEWVIGVDIRIDDQSWAEINALLAPHPRFRVAKADPFTQDVVPLVGLMLPEGPGDADLVALSRLDDDDALALDFVERVRATVFEAETRFPLSIALATGVQIDPTTGRFAAARAASIAIGLTVVSRADDILDIYGHSHMRLAGTVAAKGGESRLLEHDQAQWIHVRGAETDSGEAMKVIAMPKPTFDMTDEAAARDLLAPALAACGLDFGWVERLKRVREEHPDLASDISWDPPLRRTQIKGALLRSHRHWKAKGWPTDSLECAFYLV